METKSTLERLDTEVRDWVKEYDKMRESARTLLLALLDENDGEIDLRPCCHPNGCALTADLPNDYWDENGYTYMTILALRKGTNAYGQPVMSLFAVPTEDYDNTEDADEKTIEDWEDDFEGSGADWKYDWEDDLNVLSAILSGIMAYLND